LFYLLGIERLQNNLSEGPTISFPLIIREARARSFLHENFLLAIEIVNVIVILILIVIVIVIVISIVIANAMTITIRITITTAIRIIIT
jgi:hypothetical protein